MDSDTVWKTWWARATHDQRQLLLDMIESTDATAHEQRWEEIPIRTRQAMMVMGPPTEQLAAIDPGGIDSVMFDSASLVSETIAAQQPADPIDPAAGSPWIWLPTLVLIAMALIVIGIVAFQLGW